MKKKITTNEYSLNDLGCCVALVSSGFKILRLDKENPRKARFVFDYNSDFEKALERYWSDELRVNARTYFENIKMLKSRLYSEG